jgi:hypothetical protein
VEVLDNQEDLVDKVDSTDNNNKVGNNKVGNNSKVEEKLIHLVLEEGLQAE